MVRHSRLQQLTRDELAAVSRESLLPQEFASRVLRAFSFALPSDSCRFFGVDPRSRLLNRLLAASESDTPFRTMWLSQIYLSECSITPYFAPQVLMDQGVTAVTYRPNQSECFGLTGDLMERVESTTHFRIFHETRTPVGGSLRLLLRQGGHWVGMIDFARRGAERPFTSNEFLFARSLGPLLSKGFTKSLALEKVQVAGKSFTVDLASGVFVVSRTGAISFSTPSGEAWARRIRDLEPGSSDDLPTAVQAVVAQHRHLRSNGPAAATIDLATGRIRIEASEAGDGDSVVVVISPVLPPDPLELPSHWPLTQAERRVVALLVSGARNREIAQRLRVSEVTVETHLSHIYEKLSARGRGDVLSRLFSERFLSEFTDPDSMT